MYKTIANFIETIDVSSIPKERQEVLNSLTHFIQGKVSNKEAIRINCICTHNSRRSHLTQVWAQVMSHHFQIKQVTCYSGGTEDRKSTRLNSSHVKISYAVFCLK